MVCDVGCSVSQERPLAGCFHKQNILLRPPTASIHIFPRSNTKHELCSSAALLRALLEAAVLRPEPAAQEVEPHGCLQKYHT